MPIACPPSIRAGKTPWLLNRAHRHSRAPLPAAAYYIRYAATSSPQRDKLNGLKLPIQAVELKDRVNAPISTLPAPISVPSRRRDQSYASFLWSAGKTYLGFYKTGIKNIFVNRRLAATLRHRLNSTQTPQLPPSPNGNHNSLETSSSNPYGRYVLSRAEFQVLRRSRHDMIRVPIFGLLFLILGEWLPLVAILFTPVLPYTCRIPSQIDGERRVLERRRKRSFRGEIDGRAATPLAGDGKGVVATVDELSKAQLMHISRSLGLHIRLWDVSKGFLPLAATLKPRVKRALAYLRQDDALLIRDGGTHGLTDEEIRIACEERGIDVLGRDVIGLRQTLQRWLKSREAQTSPLPKLLSRPSSWKDRSS